MKIESIMINNWYECKLSYRKVMENGLEKNATESYLVDALSFAEAENRVIEYFRPFVSGEFLVNAVGRKKYSEVSSTTATLPTCGSTPS